MSALLNDYYRTILGGLQSAASRHNLFDHNGLKGAGNESAFGNILREFLPSRYSVGSGVIVDRTGKQSRQIDLLIYDRHNYPGLFAFGEPRMYPVELVYAVIEVKTTLDSGKAQEAINNIVSVHSLAWNREPFMHTWQYNTTSAGRVGSGTMAQAQPGEPPLGFVLGYGCQAVNLETYLGWFERAVGTGLLAEVACLTHGLVIADSPGGGVGADVPTLFDESGEPVRVGTPGRFVHNGCHYPVVQLAGQRFAVETERVLYLFLRNLLDQVARKPIHPHFSLSDYESPLMTRVACLRRQPGAEAPASSPATE